MKNDILPFSPLGEEIQAALPADESQQQSIRETLMRHPEVLNGPLHAVAQAVRALLEQALAPEVREFLQQYAERIQTIIRTVVLPYAQQNPATYQAQACSKMQKQ